MTLAEAERMAGADAERLALVAQCRKSLGERVRAAVVAGDLLALERACQLAGTHRALVGAAKLAGVDYETLEEALAGI